MLEMIRRIFKIAGRSRQKIIVGITFNILKSFFNGFMMFGVFWILLHLENLTPTIILQAFGVVLGSVIGRFFFQWMYDRTLTAFKLIAAKLKLTFNADTVLFVNRLPPVNCIYSTIHN